MNATYHEPRRVARAHWSDHDRIELAENDLDTLQWAYEAFTTEIKGELKTIKNLLISSLMTGVGAIVTGIILYGATHA